MKQEITNIEIQPLPKPKIPNIPMISEGKFIFAIFEQCKPYLEEEKIETADIARLILLSTYVSYKGVIMKNHKTPMTKEDIKKITRCSRYTTWENFWNSATEKGFIRETDEGLIMSAKYFKKGKIEESLGSKSYIRLYTDEIRYLFEVTTSRDIKKLGYFFQLLPYINFRYNVICTNPHEADKNEIEAISIGQVADMLGLGLRGFEKVSNGLSGIKTKQGDSIIGQFKTDEDKRLSKLIINPHVMYRGNWTEDDIRVIGDIFRFGWNRRKKK